LSALMMNVIGLDSKAKGLKVSGIVNLPKGAIIRHKSKKDQPSFVYVTVDTRDCQGADANPTFSIQNMLNFTITEIDIDTEEEVGSYDEDFDIPDACVTVGDYVRPQRIESGQYKAKWEEIGSTKSCKEITSSF